MFDTIRVGGRGRAGSALRKRLAKRGLPVVEHDGDLVVLCVPDGAIATVAAQVPVGPWVARTPNLRLFGLNESTLDVIPVLICPQG